NGFRIIVAEWFGVSQDSLTTEPTYGLREWGITSQQQYEDIHRFAVTQRNLFGQLSPVPGAPATLRRLSDRNIRIRIITHRLYINYLQEDAFRQTRAWLELDGFPFWLFCLRKNRSAVGADL